MKKTIFQILTSIMIISLSGPLSLVGQESRDGGDRPIEFDFRGELTAAQFLTIKHHYGWDEEQILIINYVQPRKYCHFDNGVFNSDNKKWWDAYNGGIDTEGCLNIHVFADSRRLRKKLDNTSLFDDKDDFLLENFFSRKQSCYGLMVVNQRTIFSSMDITPKGKWPSSLKF